MKLDFETNKPKSFWVAMGLAAFAPILGLLGLAAYELMGRIVVFPVVVVGFLLWLTVAVAIIYYIRGQIGGKYGDVVTAPLSRQRW
jgi:hypothetical protein